MAFFGVSTASAQADGKNYIIRFKESAMTVVKPGSLRDERTAKEPDQWGYAEERVVGHIQTLEKNTRSKPTHHSAKFSKACLSA